MGCTYYSYGMYRCVINLYDEGEPFSIYILVEGRTHVSLLEEHK